MRTDVMFFTYKARLVLWGVYGATGETREEWESFSPLAFLVRGAYELR